MRSSADRARSGWWAVLLTALAACDTGTAAAPTAAHDPPSIASGARLRAVVWEIDPEVRLFRHFFDVERNEECAFVDGERSNAAPGPVYYCLPRGAALHDATGLLALYSDAACATPVALAPFDGPSGYVIDRPVDACAAPPLVHRAGPPRTIEPYLRTEAGCVRRGGTAVVQPLGAEIPLASFVRAVEEPVPGTTRTWRLALAAADGARQPLGGWDSLRKQAMRVPSADAPDDPRWFPARVAFIGGGTLLFSDDGCLVPMPTKNARDAVCPLTAAFAYSGECGAGGYVELGARVDPAALWRLDAEGKCARAPADAGAPDVLAFANAGAMDRSAFAAATPAERGAGRVRLNGYREGSTVLAWERFFDTVTGAGCAPAPAADGVDRCLPIESASGVLFADAACSAPALERFDDACRAAPPAAFVRSSGRVYEVLGEAPALFERDGTACRRRAVSDGARAYVLGEVDVAGFAPATSREL